MDNTKVYVIFVNQSASAGRFVVALSLLRRLREARLVLDRLTISDPTQYSLIHLTVHCTREELDLLKKGPDEQFTWQQLRWVAWHASDEYYQQLLDHYKATAQMTVGQQVEFVLEVLDLLQTERAKATNSTLPDQVQPLVSQPVELVDNDPMDWYQDYHEPDISSDEDLQVATPPRDDIVDLSKEQSQFNRAFTIEEPLGGDEDEDDGKDIAEQQQAENDDERYDGGDAEPFSSENSSDMQQMFDSGVRRFSVRRKQDTDQLELDTDLNRYQQSFGDDVDEDLNQYQHSSSEEDDDANEADDVPSVAFQVPPAINAVTQADDAPVSNKPSQPNKLRELDWDRPRFRNGAPDRESDAQDYLTWEQEKEQAGAESSQDYWFWVHKTMKTAPILQSEDPEWRDFCLRFASKVVSLPAQDNDD